ncbi:MAG: TetR/AcrR family transcriptional regulator [Terriglobia bacterium]
MRKQTSDREISTHARHRDSVETRAAILKAAEQIYAEHGLAGARTDAIAAAAGVNKALLYYYFKSKEGLYQAVIGSQLREFGSQTEKLLSAKGPAGPILLRYISYHFDFIGVHPCYPRIFQRMMMEGDRNLVRIVREHSIPLMKMMVALLSRGMKSGEFRRSDPEHTLVSIAGLTAHYFNVAPAIRAITGKDPFSKGNLARRKAEALNFVRYAVFRNPEADT